MSEAIQKVLEKIQTEGLDIVDVKFIDLPGTWQHFSMHASELTAESFTDGFGFDGSSVRGFQDINESDMILIPDPHTAVTDPFSDRTLSIICTVKDPITHEWYSRCPRHIAQKAAAYLKSSGVADVSYWGPEAEFFVLDQVRYNQTESGGFYFVDSHEGIWNSGQDTEDNLGHKLRHKMGYFPVPPSDTLQNLRNEMLRTMTACGITVEVHHHEVGTAGQCEIDMRFDTLVTMADKTMLYKYIVKNTAKKHRKTATFMPKPLFNDNGSGMHVHQSLWKDGKNLMFDAAGYAGLSQMAKWYIGGLLKHAKALCAFIAPTTNSYKRLTPGFEAPVNLVYSKRNRSAAVRIPMYNQSEKAKRVEFRTPDPTANPYLAFSAMLMAGLDGIRNQIDPGEAWETDTYNLSAEEAAKIPSVPSQLKEALNALQNDHQFLLEGGVFTQDVIDTWIALKQAEVDEIRLRPHPWEFHLYYDA